MTEKIYYTDSHKKEWDAHVIDITEKDGMFGTVLDSTCIFPEGGGQPSDTGSVGETKIVIAREYNGTAVLYSESRPEYSVGSLVHCNVDWDKRFARMQAHSGEHLVSGIIHKKYGFENVGFHMDDTLMTVDFSGYLTKEQLAEIECEANAAVYENVPIKSYILHSGEQAPHYRSKLDDIKEPRLVEIVGYDICACCAPHVNSTGEIGIIKILSSASHRGGVRITIICGVTAYNEFAARYNDILSVSDILCTPHDGVPAAVRALLDKNNELKREVALQKKNELERLISSVKAADGNICLFADGVGNDDIRKAAVLLKDRCTGVCVVLCGDDKSGYSYALTSPCGGLRAFSADVNGALSGRGGGKDDMLQGRFSATRETIEKYFSEKEFRN